MPTHTMQLSNTRPTAATCGQTIIHAPMDRRSQPAQAAAAPQLSRTQRRAAARAASKLACRATAALQFDTKVFQPEKVDLAGSTEYLYRGGRDQFKKLAQVCCRLAAAAVCGGKLG